MAKTFMLQTIEPINGISNEGLAKYTFMEDKLLFICTTEPMRAETLYELAMGIRGENPDFVVVPLPPGITPSMFKIVEDEPFPPFDED